MLHPFAHRCVLTPIYIYIYSIYTAGASASDVNELQQYRFHRCVYYGTSNVVIVNVLTISPGPKQTGGGVGD